MATNSTNGNMRVERMRDGPFERPAMRPMQREFGVSTPAKTRDLGREGPMGAPKPVVNMELRMMM